MPTRSKIWMMIHDKRFTAGLIPSLSGLELQHIHTAKKRTIAAIRLCRWGRETTNKLTDSGSYPLLSCARIWRVNLQHKNETDPRMAAHQIFFLPRMNQTSALSMATVSVACLAAARRAPTKWQTNNVVFHHTSAEMLFIPSLILCLCFFSLATKICQLQINIKPCKLEKKQKKNRMQSGGLWDKNNIRMPGFYSGFDRWNTVWISVPTC